MPNVIMSNVIMSSVIMPNVIVSNLITQCVIMLSVITPSVTMLYVTILIVIIPSVNIQCHYAECPSVTMPSGVAPIKPRYAFTLSIPIGKECLKLHFQNSFQQNTFFIKAPFLHNFLWHILRFRTISYTVCPVQHFHSCL
jgi:hypothetical protein